MLTPPFSVTWHACILLLLCHITCMYPPLHMTGMYPSPHFTRYFFWQMTLTPSLSPPWLLWDCLAKQLEELSQKATAGLYLTCMYPPPHLTCILLLIWHACILLLIWHACILLLILLWHACILLLMKLWWKVASLYRWIRINPPPPPTCKFTIFFNIWYSKCPRALTFKGVSQHALWWDLSGVNGELDPHACQKRPSTEAKET